MTTVYSASLVAALKELIKILILYSLVPYTLNSDTAGLLLTANGRRTREVEFFTSQATRPTDRG